MSGLSSSQVVGPRSSTPNELMSRDLLCFLATWASKGRSQRSSFIKGSRQERCEEGDKREEEKSKTKSVFCNMLLKVTPQHFCLTLVLQSKWLGLAHKQGKGLPKSHAYQEAEVIRSHGRFCLPLTWGVEMRVWEERKKCWVLWKIQRLWRALLSLLKYFGAVLSFPFAGHSCNPCLLFFLSPNLRAATLFSYLLFLDLL